MIEIIATVGAAGAAWLISSQNFIAGLLVGVSAAAMIYLIHVANEPVRMHREQSASISTLESRNTSLTARLVPTHTDPKVNAVRFRLESMREDLMQVARLFSSEDTVTNGGELWQESRRITREIDALLGDGRGRPVAEALDAAIDTVDAGGAYRLMASAIKEIHDGVRSRADLRQIPAP